jgi:DNA-binding response OmpR family regulator
MAKAKILIVEDDLSLTEILTYNFQRDGYEVIVARDGTEGLRKAQMLHPDLIILDLMLPGLDGLEVCRQLRSSKTTSAIPILMSTAKSEETDQVIGFALGADDYVTKPFSVKVLLERVKALVRRANSQDVDSETLELGNIRLDKRSHEVTLNDEPLALTPTEFRLLEALMRQPGRAFTRYDLMESAMSDSIVLDRTVDVHIKSLRRKMGSTGSCIETVRGIGYRFRER